MEQTFQHFNLKIPVNDTQIYEETAQTNGLWAIQKEQTVWAMRPIRQDSSNRQANLLSNR